MGIQINGQNDTISAVDGSLTVSNQTLTNLVVSGSSSNELVRITQTGVGPALLVEDDTNPDSTPFAIRGDGNVGIGTTNPGSALTLFSTGPQIQFNKTNAAADSRRILLAKSDTELYVQALTDAGAGGGNLFAFYHENQQVNQFRAYQSGQVWFAVDNNSARVTVTTGSVGIGSTIPNAKFQVVAPSTTAPSLSWGASSGQIFTNEDSELAFGLSNQNPYPLYIQGRQKNGTARDIALNPLGGNIGIGTASPSDVLTVRGGRVFVNGSITSNAGDINFSTGGSRAFIDWNGSNARIGSLTGGGAGGPVAFIVSNGEVARFDTSGRLLVGVSSARANFNAGARTSAIQLEGTSADTSFISITRNSDNVAPCGIAMARARGSSVGSNTILTNNDDIGEINFEGADGTNMVRAAQIRCQIDGITGISSMPGRLTFHTTSAGFGNAEERARITSGGYFKAGNAGTYHDSTGTFHEFRQTLNNSSLAVTASDASYAANMIHASSVRTNNIAFSLMRLDTNTFTDTEFNLRGDGNAFADGTWTGGGADYAEYFEWSDSNSDAEDRRGISVVLDGDKIRPAEDNEDPIGVISGNPSIVGDAAWNKWSGKYLRDDFGTYITETHQVVEWEEQVLESEEVPAVYGEDGEVTQPAIPAKYKTVPHSYEDWNIPSGIVVPDYATYKSVDENGNLFTHRKLNPDYDPNQEYTPREQRPEWDCVGLMGKLRIRKGQPTGSRWIKMRDISETVEEWLVR